MDPLKLVRSFSGYLEYFKDLFNYSSLKNAESINLSNLYPMIHDKISTTPFDSHYFYQDIWAFKKIYTSKTDIHVDVGSRIDLIGFLTAICKVTFVDIRPLIAKLENYQSLAGSILSMPYADNSVSSLSCLHVAEHIGLARYGDTLDPLGTQKACAELSRILAVGGNLYFSGPIGKQRLCFNAHRIHSPQTIMDYFKELTLLELSGIDDKGNFIRNIDVQILERSDYACRLFHFTKEPK